MTGIFQKSTPYEVSAQSRLPGIAPLDPADWLMVDDAFGAQMAGTIRWERWGIWCRKICA